jgi:hypothetical protein
MIYAAFERRVIRRFDRVTVVDAEKKRNPRRQNCATVLGERIEMSKLSRRKRAAKNYGRNRPLQCEI